VAYKYCVPARIHEDSLGQSWKGEDIIENIALCQHQTIDAVFRRWLKKDQEVLEAGCGLGRWVFYLRAAGYAIRGLEFSPGAVAAAKAYDATIPIEQGDILKLQAADGTLPAMISLGVVEHFIEGPQKALAEAYRVLQPQGLLLISVPTLCAVKRWISHPLKDMRAKRHPTSDDAFFEYRFGVEEFASHLKNAGFQILEQWADDFKAPMSIGLYTEISRFKHGSQRWRLNRLGHLVQKGLDLISPNLYAAGTLYVCRKGG
jgi:SAM-dependent methyltransferase